MSAIASIENIGLSGPAKNFLIKEMKMFIGGKQVSAASGKTFEVIDPSTEEVIANVPEGNSVDIDMAVIAARKAFDSGPWSKMSTRDRGRLVHRIGDLILDNADELAEIESLDNGKPVGVARAADVPLAADLFHYMSGWSTKLHGQTIPLSILYTPGVEYHSYTRLEPLGVVGQIIPWNFPLLMAAWKLAPALACGCTMVLKVAEETPLSAIRLGQIMQEAGLPDGVVNIVTGFGETAGAALAAHEGVDKIAFTGSTEVGKLIVKAAANDLKRVSLELGGKSPNIVFGDADMDVAIPGAANAIFFNHGQCCCAGSRLFIEKNKFDQVVDGISKIADSIKLGRGLDPTTEMGPMVSKIQHEKVASYIESGKQDGASAAVGGGKAKDRGYFIKPTILTNTNPNMKVVKEEIFGPVVTASPIDKSEAELIAEANQTNYGLAAGIWTTDVSRAHRVSNRLKAGSVWVNCYNVFDASLPFGGYKQSGWGREMGEAVLENYTEVKAVTIPIS